MPPWCWRIHRSWKGCNQVLKALQCWKARKTETPRLFPVQAISLEGNLRHKTTKQNPSFKILLVRVCSYMSSAVFASHIQRTSVWTISFNIAQRRPTNLNSSRSSLSELPKVDQSSFNRLTQKKSCQIMLNLTTAESKEHRDCPNQEDFWSCKLPSSAANPFARSSQLMLWEHDVRQETVHLRHQRES